MSEFKFKIGDRVAFHMGRKMVNGEVGGTARVPRGRSHRLVNVYMVYAGSMTVTNVDESSLIAVRPGTVLV